ncbi:MAG: DNA-processing protein DprA [Bacillota bacterium]
MAVKELLALASVPGLGARRLAGLLAAFGSAEAALEQNPTRLRRAARLPPGTESQFEAKTLRAHLDEAEAELERVAEAGGWALGLDGPDYPSLLRTITDPPPVLFGLGDPKALARTAAAMVGTRRATPYGLTVTRMIAGDVGRAGAVVVSGLAHGIDAAAHRAVVAAGGVTVAVLGSGLRHIYPRENRTLAERMIEAGAVVSEHTLGTAPLPGHFPARNRIISGLSKAVVVVESEERGGAMITADCALEQGREVLAVPGPITSRFSRGPHALIKEGAGVVTGADDVLEAIGFVPAGRSGTGGGSRKAPPRFPGSEAELVFKALSVVPVGPDEIIRVTRLEAPAVAAALGALEVEGLIRRLPGPSYMRLTED